MERLTIDQAVVLTAQTGCLCAPFADFHAYAERLLGRPIFTHEFGRLAVADALKAASREDFLALVPDLAKGGA